MSITGDACNENDLFYDVHWVTQYQYQDYIWNIENCEDVNLNSERIIYWII